MGLMDLRATEAIDTIRKAFFAECVDLKVQGDIEDVEIEMGLRLERDTPPPKMSLIPGLPNLDDEEAWGFGPNDSFDTATNEFRHVGRNDPCPCGSGKKFKKCCLQ
jgi:preprotein translocase subunit SecA